MLILVRISIYIFKKEVLYFPFMLFAQLCDTQDEVNQTLASGALDSGIQVSLYVFPLMYFLNNMNFPDKFCISAMSANHENFSWV